jgi:hypothetical protein
MSRSADEGGKNWGEKGGLEKKKDAVSQVDHWERWEKDMVLSYKERGLDSFLTADTVEEVVTPAEVLMKLARAGGDAEALGKWWKMEETRKLKATVEAATRRRMGGENFGSRYGKRSEGNVGHKVWVWKGNNACEGGMEAKVGEDGSEKEGRLGGSGKGDEEGIRFVQARGGRAERRSEDGCFEGGDRGRVSRGSETA